MPKHSKKSRKRSIDKSADRLCGGVVPGQNQNKPRMDIHMSHSITDKNQIAKVLLGIDKKKR